MHLALSFYAFHSTRIFQKKYSKALSRSTLCTTVERRRIPSNSEIVELRCSRGLFLSLAGNIIV